MSWSPALPTLLAAVPLDRAVLLATALFAVGIIGATCRRNVLVILLSVEIMLNAANLALVAFSKVHGDVTGQVFVFFAMTVAAAEVAVGLSIVIAVYRLRRTTDANQVRDLHEVDYGPVPTLKLEGVDQHHGHAAEHDEADEEGGGHDAHGHAAAHAHAGGGH